jgi:hypothetical protein
LHDGSRNRWYVNLKTIDNFARQRHTCGEVGGIRALRFLPLNEVGREICVHKGENRVA